MRIVVLSAFYEPFMSGAEQLVKELSERIGETEEVVVLTARLQRSSVSREDRSNFILERLGVGHPWIDKFLFPLLAAWRVRRWQPDIVHAVMESYAGVALVGVKYFYPRARRLLTLQSGDLDDARKQKQWHVRLAWRMIHQTPHHLTAISNFLADRAIKLGVPADHISIIPNGVDLARIPKTLHANPYQVICVARLSWEKGLSDLIQAWKLVVAANPSVQLKIVGDGPERSKLQALISEIKLSSSITLLGRLPHQQTLAAIAESAIFVCPSLAEGLGIVFIEAQACGVPVVGTSVGGIPDVIEHEKTGLLVPPKNPAALAQALIRLLGDPALANSLRQAALRQIRRYDWTKVVDQIRVEYQRLCLAS